MKAGRRLWRTEDGGLVEDGDPAARTLAYAAGDDLSPADEAALAEPEPELDVKAARPAANKSRRPQANKGG